MIHIPVHQQMGIRATMTRMSTFTWVMEADMAIFMDLRSHTEWDGDTPTLTGDGIMAGIGVILIIMALIIPGTAPGTIHGIIPVAIAMVTMTGTHPITQPTPTMAPGNQFTGLTADR